MKKDKIIKVIKILFTILFLSIVAIRVNSITRSKITSRKNNIKKELETEIKEARKENKKFTNDPVKDAVYSDYALFLINNNDNLIRLEIEATDLYDQYIKYIKEGNTYSQNDKFWLEATDKISNIIIKHAYILKEIEDTSPNEDNKDYQQIYDMLLEGHLYMSQGIILQLEHLYDFNNEAKERDADRIINIVGNILLEIGPEVNYVRKTNHIVQYRSDKNKPIIKDEHRDEFYETFNRIIEESMKEDKDNEDFIEESNIIE